MNNENKVTTPVEKKPREFWIDEKIRQSKYCQKLVHTVRLVKPSPCEFNFRDPIHVIEYSAYEELKKLIDDWDEKDGNSPGYNKQKAITYGNQFAALLAIIREQQKSLEKVSHDIDVTIRGLSAKGIGNAALNEADAQARETLIATSTKLKELRIKA